MRARPRPARDPALHQRGDDREPRLLPATRIHPDPPGPSGRLRPGLLPQAARCLTAAGSGSGNAGWDLFGVTWCRRGLIPGSRRSRAYREFMQVATKNGRLAILISTPVAIGGRRPGLGCAAAATAAWPPAGAARREPPSPG